MTTKIVIYKNKEDKECEAQVYYYSCTRCGGQLLGQRESGVCSECLKKAHKPKKKKNGE